MGHRDRIHLRCQPWPSSSPSQLALLSALFVLFSSEQPSSPQA